MRWRIALLAIFVASTANAEKSGTDMLKCAVDLAQKNAEQSAKTDKLAEAIAGECMKGHLPERVQALLVGPNPPSDLLANENYIFVTLTAAAKAKLKEIRGEEIKLIK